MKKQNGITLIALVITIIVLLILAGVSISAITGENGIVEKAKQAKEETEAAQKKEEENLQSIVDYMDENEEVNLDLDLLERYVLGEDKNGRIITEIADVDMDNGEISFKNEESTIADASSSIKCLLIRGNGSEYSYVYIKYNNKVYMTTINSVTYTTKDVELYYQPQGNEGKTVNYDSNEDGNLEEWIVITDRNGTLEIASTNIMYDDSGNGLTLGDEDTTVEVTSDIDGDGIVGNDEDIAVLSYTNAVKTINEFCNEVVIAEDNDGVRSIGEDLNSESEVLYSSINFDKWYKGNVNIKMKDVNYDDYVKLSYWEMPQNYSWIPYLWAWEEDTHISFSIGFGMQGIRMVGNTIWQLGDDGSVIYTSDITRGVIPVVINPQNYEYVTE